MNTEAKNGDSETTLLKKILTVLNGSASAPEVGEFSNAFSDDFS